MRVLDVCHDFGLLLKCNYISATLHLPVKLETNADGVYTVQLSDADLKRAPIDISYILLHSKFDDGNRLKIHRN